MSQSHKYGPSYVSLAPPMEYVETGVDATTNDSVVEASLGNSLFTFVGDAAVYLFNWRTTNGVFNGVPYQIEIKSELNTSTTIIFDGYIDLGSPECEWDSMSNPTIVRAPIVRIDDNKSVIDTMAIITQGLLIKKGILTHLDFVDVPVIRESKKNVAERALILANFGNKCIQALTQMINNFLSSLSDVVGLSVVIGAIELLLTFVNAVTVIQGLVNEGMKIKDLFFPQISYYKGFSLKKIIEKGFAYLNYTVEFGIIEPVLNNVYVLASQNEFNGYPFPGFPATGPLKPQDFGYTIMECIDVLNKMFNIRADVRNGVVHLRNRKDPFWVSAPAYTPENVLVKTVQQYQNGIYKDDVERVKATFMLNYTYDTSDCHTLTEKNGDSFECHRDLIVTLNGKMKTIKGFDEKVIPWAMCVRKKPFDNLWDLFTGISGQFDSYLTAVKARINEFIAELNASGVDVAAQLSTILSATGLNTFLINRTGCLKIDDNAYAIPKVLYMTADSHGQLRIPENFKDFIGARALYYAWHFSDSPAIQNEFKGQYRLVKNLQMRWSYEKFIQTQTNPYFIFDGSGAKFLYVQWVEQRHSSATEIELNQKFDSNITEEEIV